MNYTVVWSHFAEKQLDEIFEYYFRKVNVGLAKRIIGDLIKETDRLRITPFIGQLEPLLHNFSLEYRYLILGNYKIIYTVDSEYNLIKISDIFDTRQNPVKINRIK